MKRANEAPLQSTTKRPHTSSNLLSNSIMSTAPTISVSWEVAKYLIPDASKGDPQAILLLIRLACPDWADVKLADFTAERLGGGFSGNVPYKCMAEGKDTLAFKVIPPEDGEEEDDGPTMCETAFKLWSREGIVPKVHLLGNPNAPGIEIYEFIEGKVYMFSCYML